MRIISGKRRGYKLTAPGGLDTRPTTDRVKESVFNIIQNHLPCRLVLDLFAGSGAMGIEAISRGAECVVFAENNPASIKVIEENLRGSGLQSNAAVYKTDAFALLSELSELSAPKSDGMDLLKIPERQLSFDPGEGFDIIFLDPPYNKGLVTKALDMIYDFDLLNDNGIIVAETEVLGEDLSGTRFKIKKSAKYGKTLITVMQR